MILSSMMCKSIVAKFTNPGPCHDLTRFRSVRPKNVLVGMQGKESNVRVRAHPTHPLLRTLAKIALQHAQFSRILVSFAFIQGSLSGVRLHKGLGKRLAMCRSLFRNRA